MFLVARAGYNYWYLIAFRLAYELRRLVTIYSRHLNIHKDQAIVALHTCFASLLAFYLLYCSLAAACSVYFIDPSIQ